MSIHIIGMEMPKSCAGCPAYRFGYTLDSDCWNVCAACGKDLNNPFGIGRPDWCPASPVPPHGRLIDASEKIRVQLYDDMTEDFHMVEMTIDDLLSQGWVEAVAPTIIPAEEGE